MFKFQLLNTHHCSKGLQFNSARSHVVKSIGVTGSYFAQMVFNSQFLYLEGQKE